MDKNMDLSYYALANYVEENRDAALNSSFKGKKLKDFITLQSDTGAVDDKAISSFIVDHCDDPVLVSMQLEVLVQHDPAEFVSSLQKGADMEQDGALKEQKLECLLRLAGHAFPLEEGVSKLEQLESQCRQIGSERLLEGILNKLDRPEAPVAALALYVGADKPWVRHRLEQTKDPQVWHELVAGNFNSSPKVLLTGLQRLTSPDRQDMPHPMGGLLAETLWGRPDCQLYISDRRDQLKYTPADTNLASLPDAEDLAVLVGSSEKTRVSRAESVAELYALLDKQLASRQPPSDLLEHYASQGCSAAQAQLRATYCQYAGLQGAGTANPVAARRLAASLQAPRQVDRSAPVPSSFGSWKKRLHEFIHKCSSTFTDLGSKPNIAPHNLGQTPPHEGYQSWEHKDILVAQIEDKLKKDYRLKMQNSTRDDPWKFLGGKLQSKPLEVDSPDM
jgi:hypothetical protein